MIEEVIIDYLNSTLSIPVYSERPDESPDRFVLAEKIGSRNRNKLEESTFAFQSYAPSMYKAAKLNQDLIVAVNNMIRLENIVSVSRNSDYNFTDTTTKEYRYQAVFDIAHY